jgi:hypothetical protein
MSRRISHSPIVLALAGSPDGMLSEQEVARIERVESFEIIVAPIENDATAKNLAEACFGLPELPNVPGEREASLPDELAGGSTATLARALDALRIPATQQSPVDARIAAENVARMLASVGHDIDRLCKKVAAGALDDDDIALLRTIYREDGATLLRYANLLEKPSVVELVDKLLGPAPAPDEDVRSFVQAIEVEPTGVSRALPTSLNLGAAATVAFEGLGQFLIDRAKQETLLYVRDTLVARICGSDIRVFVSKTCEVMSNLDPSIALGATGKLLHAAIVADLEVMPDRLLVLAWMRSADVAYPATLVRLGLPMLGQAKLRTNPLELAASIHKMPETDCEAEDPASSGDAHCSETLAYLRLAAALLRAAAGNVESAHDTRALPFLVLATAFDFERFLTEIPTPVLERIKLPRLSFDRQGLKSWNDLIGKSIAAASELESLVTSLAQTNPLTGESTATPTRLVTIARASVVELVELARMAGELNPSADVDELMVMSSAIRSDDWGRSALAMFDAVTAIVEDHADDETEATLDATFDQLRAFLPLFVEIANAKSSADVEAALEAAFPARGFRLKYRQDAIALNAYLGGYGGGVYLLDDHPQLSGEAAMFAPIGVEISWPITHPARNAWHVGLFVAAVDLGAITTSKFLATEVAIAPQADGETVTHEQPARFNVAGLLSPGLYFTVGIAESPFSLGVGASVNPFVLQEVHRTYVDGKIDSQSQHYLTALRFGVFLAADITMIAFGRKGR